MVLIPIKQQLIYKCTYKQTKWRDDSLQTFGADDHKKYIIKYIISI